MSNIRKALFYSVLSQNSIQIISFLTIAILARLLTPAEIGVFAVASSLVFLAIELRSLGVGQYLIREEEIDPQKIRSSIGMMITISWGLAVSIIVAAPSLATFYNQPGLTYIFWIISITFVISPFSSVPFALLTRNMQFKELFLVKLASTLARSASTIGFVLIGLSYYGLALGTLTGAVIEFVAISFFRPPGTPWLPSFKGFKLLIQFGLTTSTANMLQKFTQSIPDLVLGRLATMADVGLFSRGLGLVLFLNKMVALAVSPIVLPHLSRIRRAGHSVADAYLKAIVLQGVFSLPIFAVVNLAADPMISALFGDQWGFAVPIAATLSIWGMLQSIHCFSSSALLAVDKENLMLFKELIVFVSRFIAVVLTATLGLKAVAWAIVGTGLIEFMVNSWAINKAIGLSIKRVAIAFRANILITLLCWCVLLIISYVIPFKSYNPWLILSIIGASMISVWLITLRITNHEVWDIAIQVIQRTTPARLKREFKG